MDATTSAAIPLETVVAVLIATGLGAAVTWLVQQRRSRPPRIDPRVPQVPVAFEAQPTGRALRTTIEQALPSDLHRAEQARKEAEESAADRRILQPYLADIRDLMAAQEAVYWEWIEERDLVKPAAWSSEGADRPLHFRMGEWGPHVGWSVNERLIQTAGADPMHPQLAVAPVMSGERVFGAVSVTAEAGLRIGKDAIRTWLPRHARHIARLLESFEIRRAYGQVMRQGQAFLHAAERLRGMKSREKIATTLCTMALEVTSAGDAALVRWGGDSHGEVQYATAGLGVAVGFQVDPDSVVGRACIDGLPVVFEDSVPIREGELFGRGDRFCGAGSAAVVPIIRDDMCLGALVIVADAAGAISQYEARNASLLGALAITSLEIVWDMEEVDRRTRIDPLTGLGNRRHFESELSRIINETDRFGGAGSLVLVDIDHFKRVNDTYGHEAGDAVLRQVARTLAEGVRTVDVCFRYGGEELAILLPQTSVAGAVELAERLRKRIEDRVVRIGEDEIRVTASFGVASYPEQVNVRDSLFPAADRALYQAKHDGRNCVRSASVSRNPT